MDEQWAAIPGYEGLYQVSDQGRVRTIGGGQGAVVGRIRKPVMGGWHAEYLTVQLRRDGIPYNGSVHRLVLLAFEGPGPDGNEVNHKNGVKTDNRLENLEYVTREGNMRHAWDTGLFQHRTGERSANHKLTADQVREIRQAVRIGKASRSQLARDYGVGPTAVCYLVSRKTWQSVE